jgi:hypothetical protein
MNFGDINDEMCCTDLLELQTKRRRLIIASLLNF